ncbi:MAG: response regulator [Candidatus Lokiarchaeota archaeon]
MLKIGQKILIVDDEPDIVNLTESFLQLENYDTLTCNSGGDALKIIEKHHKEIMLVLLDIMMPHIDGYTVLEKIKSNEKYKEILVILFTVKNFKFDIIKGKELGADGYLLKAISGKALLDYVRKILKDNKEEDEKEEEEEL